MVDIMANIYQILNEGFEKRYINNILKEEVFNSSIWFKNYECDTEKPSEDIIFKIIDFA